ncbi:hypothetical protein [Rhodococcus koreensis]
MIQTDERTDTLPDLDAEIPCGWAEVNDDYEHGPARWRLSLRLCPKKYGDGPWITHPACDQCVQIVMSRIEQMVFPLVCADCGEVITLVDDIVKMVRL